jgi:hypothetical protein
VACTADASACNRTEAEGTFTGMACKGPLEHLNFPCKGHRTSKSVCVSFNATLLSIRGSWGLGILCTGALMLQKHLPLTGSSRSGSSHEICFLMINPFQISVKSAL